MSNENTRSTPVNTGLQIGDIDSKLGEILGSTETATGESTEHQELAEGGELEQAEGTEDENGDAMEEGEADDAQTEQQETGPQLLSEEDEAGYLVDMGDGQQMSIEDVKRGYMRDAHFTQVMQENAKSRQNLENLSNNLDAAVFSVANILDAELQPYQGVNWEQLALSNQQAYQQYKPQFDALNNYVNRIKETYQQAQTAIAETEKKQLEQAWKQTDTHLKFRIAKWGDERKDQLKAFGKKYGFEADELDKVPDHRLWSMMNDLERLTAGVKPGKPGKPTSKRRTKPGPQNQGSRVAQLKSQADKGDRRATNELRAMSIDAKLKNMGIG